MLHSQAAGGRGRPRGGSLNMTQDSTGRSQGIPHEVLRTVRFGDFTLDPATRQLHRDGREVHLSPKAFDLLATLIARRPGVVDKESLREVLWPGTNVVDANLNNLASEIRAALDDDPQAPRFLRTAHRIGYAFCGVAMDDREPAADRLPARGWLMWKDRTFALIDALTTLGRDPHSAVRIDAPGVSRRHASIRMTGEGERAVAVIEDLASTNGTFVNGRRIREPLALEDGQTVDIGEATLTFRAWSSAGAPTKKIRRR
jgi:DNA-binding winged helix-turn-helix (wHTH) protein